MSAVRSLYRQILKQAHKASSTYKNPNDLCFALFGIMLRMEDFVLAGYGSTYQEVVRTLFMRPMIPGDAQDTFAVHLSAGFDSLRRLSEIVSARTKPQKAESGNLIKKTEGQPAVSGRSDQSQAVGDEDSEEDGPYIVAKGTIFIESSLSRKVKKMSRKIVLCKDLRELPPYRCMMPPEPLYPKNTQARFKLPLMRDAMICIASSAKRKKGEDFPSISTVGLVRENYSALFDSIPTRTVTVTDHVEVELRTEYVCSRYTNEDQDSDSTDEPNWSASPGTGTGTVNNGVKEYVFRYFVFIRNYGISRNEKKWHVQLMSRHWVLFDEEVNSVGEVVGPGVMGNFPLLAPGESHIYESGTSLSGSRGVMRGTLQVNVFNEDGDVRCIDVYISPTRLTTAAAVPAVSVNSPHTHSKSSGVGREDAA